jgi:hypothetical protein
MFIKRRLPITCIALVGPARPSLAGAYAALCGGWLIMTWTDREVQAGPRYTAFVPGKR